jgi:hypothetical protein
VAMAEADTALAAVATVAAQSTINKQQPQCLRHGDDDGSDKGGCGGGGDNNSESDDGGDEDNNSNNRTAVTATAVTQ